MFREDDGVGGTGEEYPSDGRVSRFTWRVAVLALCATIGATVLIILAIFARPDVRRAAPLWADEFDSLTGGWEINLGEGEVSDGVLTLHPSRLDSPALGIHTLPTDDFVAETRARVGAGSTDNAYGIVVGDAHGLIAFLISGDGYYGVMRHERGNWVIARPWRQWPHVRRGDAPNTLRLECRGVTCAFYVSDEITTQVEMPGRRDVIGLAGWRYTDDSLEVESEYLKVWKDFEV